MTNPRPCDGAPWPHASQPGRLHFMKDGRRRYVDPSGRYADPVLYRRIWQEFVQSTRRPQRGGSA